jgi:outer membrane protein OmpA-like peptidoglycan-associated protein
MGQRSSLTSLHLQPEASGVAERRPERGGGRGLLLLLLLLILVGLGGGGYLAWQRLRDLEQQVARLAITTGDNAALARQAAEQAAAAESAARRAAEGRQVAETQMAQARQEADASKAEADAARQQAETAQQAAARAQTEAQQIRAKAEAEVDRLEQALGGIAETRRTALGVVMNLSGDHLKFEFDKADLRPQDRELLSRIAGVLLASAANTHISVNGHTDDVGTDAYNQKLSERRAESVRDYLIKSGLPADMFSVTGHGKSVPLAPGTSEAARARNRRVELGIADSRLLYYRRGANAPSPQ